jgi:hypothetical protein
MGVELAAWGLAMKQRITTVVIAAFGASVLAHSAPAQEQQGGQTPTTQTPNSPNSDSGDRNSRGHGSGSGAGFGISIDLNRLFEDKPKPQDVPKKNDANGDKAADANGAPTPVADQLPKAPSDDPEGGIKVPGGKVHRGTGEYTNPDNPKDKRAAFYLWVDLDADGGCKACSWYQFAKITATYDGKDVTAKLATYGAINSSIGAPMTFGKWNGDYYKGDEDKKSKKPPHVKMPGEKNPPEAGPYAPRHIPGTSGSDGLVDAPNWGSTGAWGKLAQRLADSGAIKTRKTGNKPPDSIGTLVLTTNFRSFLYCVDPPPPKCLGYSEQTYIETIKLKITWSAESGVSDSAGLPDGTPTTWTASVSVDSDTSSVTFGPWKACP